MRLGQDSSITIKDALNNAGKEATFGGITVLNNVGYNQLAA